MAEITPEGIKSFYENNPDYYVALDNDRKTDAKNDVSGFFTVCGKVGGADKSFLDVGCGSGYNASLLAPKFKEAVGVDLNVDYAKKHYKNVVFLKADAHELTKTINRKFDLIYSFDALEHMHEPSIVLAEMFKLLKPKGVMLIQAAYPGKVIRDYRLEKYKGVTSLRGLADHDAYHRIAPQGLFDWFVKHFWEVKAWHALKRSVALMGEYKR